MTDPQTLPLPGPLQRDPTSEVQRLALAAINPNSGAGPAQKQAQVVLTSQRLADAMLFSALAGINLGDWDGQIINWLREKDVSVVATVASLLRRDLEAGVESGRRERLNEHPVIAALTTRVEDLERQIEQLRDQS